MRKSHTPREKAQLVLEVLKGENTLNEIAAHNNIHPTLLTRWKKQTIEGLPGLFEGKAGKNHQKAIEIEKERDDLYKQIGKLTTQIEWMKKKSGL